MASFSASCSTGAKQGAGQGAGQGAVAKFAKGAVQVLCMELSSVFVVCRVVGRVVGRVLSREWWQSLGNASSDLAYVDPLFEA